MKYTRMVKNKPVYGTVKLFGYFKHFNRIAKLHAPIAGHTIRNMRGTRNQGREMAQSPKIRVPDPF
jgi:hypothetical protein